VDDKTVYTERLFFSGYYEKWYILPSSFMEFQQDVVATVIPELTNTRLRRIITSMPPYSPETVLDFGLIQAHGIFANLHVKPWHPGWRITCAWECRYRKYHQLYEALAVEWWQHYFNLMDMPLPSEVPPSLLAALVRDGCGAATCLPAPGLHWSLIVGR
jgi:hypothetical protein